MPGDEFGLGVDDAAIARLARREGGAVGAGGGESAGDGGGTAGPHGRQAGGHGRRGVAGGGGGLGIGGEAQARAQVAPLGPEQDGDEPGSGDGEDEAGGGKAGQDAGAKRRLGTRVTRRKGVSGKGWTSAQSAPWRTKPSPPTGMAARRA